MESVVVWFIFIMTMFSLTIVYADYQADALDAFKQKISDDPKDVTKSWVAKDPCTRFHITCDKDGNVIAIDLGGAGLSGQLAPELGKLAHLQKLELYQNNLDGEIPEEIGHLFNLITLDLYNNSLSGLIPLSLEKLMNLQNLRLQNNKLTGPVPLGFPCLNLTDVNVAGNDLCGPFTARCIDPNDPWKCTNDLLCPCRCGQYYNNKCDLENTPPNNTRCCQT